MSQEDLDRWQYDFEVAMAEAYIDLTIEVGK